MRKINFIFAIILISLLLLSLASIAFSQPIKKTFELPEFKSIYLNSNYTVLLKQTNKQEVIAEAPSDVMELTNVVVDNGVLMVNVEPWITVSRARKSAPKRARPSKNTSSG